MVTHYATERSFFQSFAWIYAIQIMNLNISGDEFARRLCDPLPPVTAVFYYRWLAAGLHDKMIS